MRSTRSSGPNPPIQRTSVSRSRSKTSQRKRTFSMKWIPSRDDLSPVLFKSTTHPLPLQIVENITLGSDWGAVVYLSKYKDHFYNKGYHEIFVRPIAHYNKV